MQNLQYSKILKTNWEIVALIMGLAILLALVISLVQPFQYAASTKLLIIQKQEINTDAYTATKSAERIGQNLANIIFTSSFYNDVIDSNASIESRFSQDSTERRKEWEKNIEVNVAPETGLLEITVYDTDKNFASQLVRSIAYVLVTKGAEYHGGGTNVEIKVVDDVFLSKYPKRPNIILNGSLALIIGFLFGSALVVLSEAKRVKKNTENSYPVQIPNDSQDYEARPNNDWQLAEAIETNDFGFVPVEEENVDNFKPERKTEIITMYDHLK